MARGRKPKAGGLRPDQRKPVKELTPLDNPKVPSLPSPQDWLSRDEWPIPVREWWDSIWTSPMAGEFVDSDIHGLYLAAVYLAEGLDPYIKLSERLKSLKAWEQAIKSYGLTPTAREGLRWAIATGEAAEVKTKRARAKATTPPAPQTKATGVQANVIELYRQHS